MPARLASFEHSSADFERLRAMLASPREVGQDAGGDVPAPGAQVRAWAEEPERQGGTTFDVASPRARISWEGQSGSGSCEVPPKVAQAFGREPREFASVPRLEAHLEGLMRSCAWERLLALVRARERASADVRAKLVEAGYPGGVARDAVARAERCLLIDDGRFATSYVRAKARSGWGRERIARELGRMQVPDEDVRSALACVLSADEERSRAREALGRKRVPERDPVPKLARFLVGRGFATDVAFGVAREYVQDMNAL